MYTCIALERGAARGLVPRVDHHVLALRVCHWRNTGSVMN